MNRFLGQVPIRMTGLGQGNEPPWSVEREIKKKQTECYFLRISYNSAVAKYYEEGTPSEFYDESLEPARLALNNCIDELDELYLTEKYGPLRPVQAAWHPFTYSGGLEPVPLEPNEPEEPEPEPESFTSAPWPTEIPKPTIEPVPPEEPELVEPKDCDPSKEFFDYSTGQCRVLSEDWRTSGCSRGTQRLVRGGACVSPGLISTALTSPMTNPSFTLGRIPLMAWRGTF